jgi:hypothetical protein
MTLDAAIAEAARRNDAEELSRAEATLDAPETFGEVVERWRAANVVRWRKRTIIKYDNHLRQIPADWLRRKISSITPDMAEAAHAKFAQDHAGVPDAETGDMQRPDGAS